MSTQTYNFYMQKVEWNEVSSSYTPMEGEAVKDLEKDFKGLRYVKCEGLEDTGEARIYTETYADSDRTRVFIPSPLTNEATTVKLTLMFWDTDTTIRQDVFDEFNEYIRSGFLAYWDSARKRKLIFYVKSATKPSEDVYKGSVKYIQCTYTLENVYGKTTRTSQI